jgi:hypothetical protein
MELLQFSIGGADVWRRVLVYGNCRLDEIHRIVQTIFGWKDSQLYQFSAGKVLENSLTLREAGSLGNMELLYEYGSKWTVRIMFLSHDENQGEQLIRCIAGEGAAPPEHVDGPLRFRRFLSALESGNEEERRTAEEELGREFKGDIFNIERCNAVLKKIQEKKWQIPKQKTDSEN